MPRRKTGQRDAIRKALRESSRPLTPQEILDQARCHAPTLGMATIYRAVKDFQEDGWLAAVDFPGEPTRYELSSLPHHHHFHCRDCGKMFDIEGCPGGLARLLPPGFVMESHEVLFKGLCPACADGVSA